MILIQSCKKNLWKYKRIKETWGKDIGIDIIFMVGDPELETEYIFDNEHLTVKCKDDYDNLTLKMNIGLKAVYEKFNPIYIVKIDDDIIINCKKFKKELNTILTEEVDYCGRINIVKKGTSLYYKLYKFEDKNVTYLDRDALYCSGGVVYFSKKSLKIISENYVPYYSKYDDMNIGIFLQENGIKALFKEEFTYTENEQEFLDEKYACFHDDNRIYYQNK